MNVAIIGAGINGLYLAQKLSQSGHKVTVFEKRDKIGKQACSGLFSERILDFIPESQKLIKNQINSVLIHFPKRTIKIRFSKKFFVISHFELDNLVSKLAEMAGAKIILNNPITSLPENFDRVIGCDGPNSIIRKILKLEEPAFRLAIQGFIPKQDNSDFVETWPIREGFIWRIPRENEIEYGAIGNHKEVKAIFESFLEKNNFKLDRIESAIVPQGLLISHDPLITLCGDSVGLTKPWSGGGVIWGLRAGDMLLKNFPDFSKYAKELRKFFGPKIMFSKIAVKLVYFLGYKMPWLLPKNIKIESDFLL